MNHILSLDSSIVTNILEYLSLKDVVRFASSCRQLHQLTFDTAEVWSGHLLFEDSSKDIDDQVIASIVPHITRSYGIQSLRLVNLDKVSPMGILQVFDQFAHALQDIELSASKDVIKDLTRHLEAFALKLALLQGANLIPLTFLEYRSRSQHYIEQLGSYMSESPKSEEEKMAVCNSHAELSARLRWLRLPTRLDDPPFEQLEKIKITFTDEVESSDRIFAILKLRSLMAYLAGTNLENNLDSDVQPHRDTHDGRWYSIIRKHKISDLDSKLDDVQPSVVNAEPDYEVNQQCSTDSPANVPPVHYNPETPSKPTPVDLQDTPRMPINNKRKFAHAEPRPSEESKKARRSPPTSQPIVKVYRYRRRQSSNSEQPEETRSQQHVYRPNPVSY